MNWLINLLGFKKKQSLFKAEYVKDSNSLTTFWNISNELSQKILNSNNKFLYLRLYDITEETSFVMQEWRSKLEQQELNIPLAIKDGQITIELGYKEDNQGWTVIATTNISIASRLPISQEFIYSLVSMNEEWFSQNHSEAENIHQVMYDLATKNSVKAGSEIIHLN